MASGVSGDFGRLAATINALKNLARVPSRVAVVAAPRLTTQLQADANASRNPYGKAYEPHAPATVKRWGPHQILRMSGNGIDSLKATPAPGAGINVSADDHMNFTQSGTPTQPVRAVLPNRPQLPATYNRILEQTSAEVLNDALKAAK
jgi:hypothetical protein